MMMTLRLPVSCRPEAADRKIAVHPIYRLPLRLTGCLPEKLGHA
jgi:hypothetical protein